MSTCRDWKLPLKPSRKSGEAEGRTKKWVCEHQQDIHFLNAPAEIIWCTTSFACDFLSRLLYLSQVNVSLTDQHLCMEPIPLTQADWPLLYEESCLQLSSREISDLKVIFLFIPLEKCPFYKGFFFWKKKVYFKYTRTDPQFKRSADITFSKAKTCN